MASLASKTLILVVFAPKGKPITVHTLTKLPFKIFAASSTLVGFTQTDENYILALLYKVFLFLHLLHLASTKCDLSSYIYLYVP